VSEQEYIYIHSGLDLAAEARLVSDLLDLQIVSAEPNSPEATEIELTGSARVSDAERVSVWIEVNDRAIPDGPPELTSAADNYPFEVYVRVFGGLAGQADEARWIFDELVNKRPDTPMLLTHEGIDLVAAYLPDRGVHDFPPGTELGPKFELIWRDWIPAASGSE
jgi:hypothetical protein